MKTEDWRSACIILAGSYLQFIELVAKACPNNETLQNLGKELGPRLSEIVATGAIDQAKQ